ncbi:hypothetical protein PAERUG_E5_London_17_VIM_2_12_12_06031 [Pseudomonas aeruginosa]|nr:hypothetical protein PAERUG_E5_London_17_VIM_2_12_12_06031 [Pseudomonas aeruginosa]
MRGDRHHRAGGIAFQGHVAVQPDGTRPVAVPAAPVAAHVRLADGRRGQARPLDGDVGRRLGVGIGLREDRRRVVTDRLQRRAVQLGAYRCEVLRLDQLEAARVDVQPGELALLPDRRDGFPRLDVGQAQQHVGPSGPVGILQADVVAHRVGAGVVAAIEIVAVGRKHLVDGVPGATAEEHPFGVVAAGGAVLGQRRHRAGDERRIGLETLVADVDHAGQAERAIAGVAGAGPAAGGTFAWADLGVRGGRLAAYRGDPVASRLATGGKPQQHAEGQRGQQGKRAVHLAFSRLESVVAARQVARRRISAWSRDTPARS